MKIGIHIHNLISFIYTNYMIKLQINYLIFKFELFFSYFNYLSFFIASYLFKLFLGNNPYNILYQLIFLLINILFE